MKMDTKMLRQELYSGELASEFTKSHNGQVILYAEENLFEMYGFCMINPTDENAVE